MMAKRISTTAFRAYVGYVAQISCSAYEMYAAMHVGGKKAYFMLRRVETCEMRAGGQPTLPQYAPCNLLIEHCVVTISLSSPEWAVDSHRIDLSTHALTLSMAEASRMNHCYRDSEIRV